MKITSGWLLFGLLLFCSCSKAAQEEASTTVTLDFISSDPADGDVLVDFKKSFITFLFAENIKINQPQNIKINGEPVRRVSANLLELSIQVELMPDTEYTITIPEKQLSSRERRAISEKIEISFRTKDIVYSKLVTNNPSVQAQNLYAYLQTVAGEKIITGTMANVAWNINEAEWVKYHTGVYPALNCFDYIHLYASPAGWIDYTNTEVVESWWQNNGLVAAMWHWNVPKSKNSNDFAFYTDETDFDITRAVIPGTDEYGIVMADMNKLADQLLLLKQKHIPVLWRPLHEAAGKWFWWGAKGAAPAKKLWQMMFDLFNERGVNNLIWVWTAQGGDDDLYPGDEYVDIIGVDIYDKNIASIVAFYQDLENKYPGKMLALSEFGNIPDISEQWQQGVKWLWTMPWYDYERTVSVQNEPFKQNSHQFADLNYWERILQMGNDLVITRNDVPDLK